MVAPRPSRAAPTHIEAIVFDAFPIFDPRPIFQLTENMFPGRGKELSDLWRTRQFEYTWLRTAGGRYRPFWDVTRDALHYAGRSLGLTVDERQVDKLMGAYLALKSWPDVPDALAALKEQRLRLGFLSNFTKAMLEAAIDSAGLKGYFEQLLTTDALERFKPDPAAYRMAIDAFGVPRESILFVPFAGWDVAGAKWFGYETFWVNRLGLPLEALDATPDGTGKTLTELVTYLDSRA
jgi:2-haloacid dehalogenase